LMKMTIAKMPSHRDKCAPLTKDIGEVMVMLLKKATGAQTSPIKISARLNKTLILFPQLDNLIFLSCFYLSPVTAGNKSPIGNTC